MMELSVGPLITLVGGEGDIETFTLKCVTDEGEQLNALIVTHTLETIPQPTIIALDYETGILDWSHPFHPDLPVDFEIIHRFRVVYLVNETDRDSGETVISHESSLSVSRLLDHCRRQEFTVQTLVNDIFYSQSSSYLTNPSAPAFLTISPSLVVEDDTKVSVKVKFALEASVCISQFHVIIDGVVNISFNVTSPDRERGEVTYNLSPYLSSEGVCDVGGMVYGSNNIGESTQVQIPRGGSHCTPTGITAIPTPPSTTPTLTPPYSEESAPSISVPVIITVSVLSLFMIGTVTIIIIIITLILCYKKKGRQKSVVPPVSATCPDDVAPKVSSDEAAVGTYSDISIDPAVAGLSLESHYDLLLAVLMPLKTRCFELGMNLDLSENFPDETETNMDSVEECLGEMLQNWLLYHDPTMETLNNALSRMNLSPITFNTTSSEFVSVPE
ncbi:hypothetical protein GBAR_LOCUS14113 [Geodia barretti]|uniref:Death domain-containing protein n=1 Tax=Geodia barretti TaxID=519541 RepID=A0AA35S986_GEOBA|nr:hypothetical protein GBAR_LOCUS14113 [Geodia barretti]